MYFIIAFPYDYGGESRIKAYIAFLPYQAPPNNVTRVNEGARHRPPGHEAGHNKVWTLA